MMEIVFVRLVNMLYRIGMSDKNEDKADESSGVVEPSILEGVKVETLRRVLIRVLGTEI